MNTDSVTNTAKGLVGNVMNTIKSPSFLLYTGVVLLFLGIGYYLYYYYILPRINPSWVANNEYLNKDAPEQQEYRPGPQKQPDQPEPTIANVYLFHADWCPYSKKVLPTWNQVKDDMDNKIYNNHRVNFIEIDGDKQPQDLNFFEVEYLKNAEKKKIDGYPSIYLVKDGSVTEFDAEPTVDTLTEFIKSVL
jgi:thiol-disulfide isomerase/thioredoxin